MPKYMTRKELVAWSGNRLSFWAVGDLTRRKILPHIRLGARLILYDTEQIEKFLSNLGAQSVQQEPGKLRAVR